MTPEMVAQVRRFNRTVTQRIGALNDDFLASHRSLGQNRLLWEIGPDGRDLRTLRSRLDLDSGYLSRLVRTLLAAGLIEVEPSAADGRVRVARLTDAGHRELAMLDRRSDAAAAAILRPLNAGQRDRLVTAMAEVQRLLTASTVEVRDRDPADPDAAACLANYFDELARRFARGFDPALSRPVRADDITPPAGLLLVASLHGEPVGCGALRFHPDRIAEVKRMWVSPAVRGLGLGRRILAELEDRARSRGVRLVRLDTNACLTEAIAMYRGCGYREVAAFNDERYADHWFEKALPSA